MKRIWKSMFCFLTAVVVGISGFMTWTLPVYGETGAMNEKVPGMETEAMEAEEAALDTENEGTEEAVLEIEQETGTESSLETETACDSGEAGRVSEEISLYEARTVQAANGLTLTVDYPSEIKYPDLWLGKELETKWQYERDQR